MHRATVFVGGAGLKAGPGTFSQKHPYVVPNTAFSLKRISYHYLVSIFYSLLQLLLQAWARLRDHYVLELYFCGAHRALSRRGGRKDLCAPLSPVYSSAVTQTLRCVLATEGVRGGVESQVPTPERQMWLPVKL